MLVRPREPWRVYWRRSHAGRFRELDDQALLAKPPDFTSRRKVRPALRGTSSKGVFAP